MVVSIINLLSYIGLKKIPLQRGKKPTEMQYMSTKCSEMECKLNS